VGNEKAEVVNDTRTDELTEWVTTAEAAKMLSRSRRRVLQLIKAGELEAKQLNPRLWLVNRQSVKEYRATM
jgi:excisionase family DNA binding protein